MRILMVNSAIPTMFGGGEKWFVEAASGFLERGHEVILVGRPFARLLETAAARGVTTREFGFGGDFDPIASIKAALLLRRERPDVIITNFNKDVWLFGRGASLFGIPVVARHGLMAYKGKFHYKLLHRWHVDRLVVNAPAILDHYRSLGFDVDDAQVILNGVRAPEPKPGELRRRYGLPEGVPIVVTFGRLALQKQLDMFVAVARQIVDAGIDARFVVMGDGAVRERLLGWIEEAGLSDRFVVPGFVEDAAAISCDADLFLLTSKNEGTPNALLEAMAVGCCCLSTDVGAVPLVLEGIGEAVVGVEDEETMGQRSIALLEDRARRTDIARRQRTQALECFGYDASLSAYLRLLDDAIAGAKSG